ncbi:MAG: aldo/keto reductase [Lachnospiraceae bacterium]|jgi:predicted aldo/keto reductase-like oxidoreductase|nr:aldo/keto reductase [Lachnospiraceae bacterium]
MTEIKLGRTEIKTNIVGFGALPIQRVPVDYASLLLRKAYTAGVTFYDTARSYTDSEEKIGRSFRDIFTATGEDFDSHRKNIYIATKTPATNKEQLLTDLDTSLDLMGLDYIDVYQFHNPAECPLPGDESGLYEGMLEAKKAGKIRFIGITSHRLHVAKEAVVSGLYDTLQFPFSYLATDEEVELVKLCQAENVGFIAMKALAGGLITRADAAYAFLAQYQDVLPIWGVQREREIDEILGFIDNPPEMNDELRAIIANDKKELASDFCRSCAYCMPCPVGIIISQCARMSQLIRRSPSSLWLNAYGQSMMSKIDECTECGECRDKCPYHLNTPELLKNNLDDYRRILSGETNV